MAKDLMKDWQELGWKKQPLIDHASWIELDKTTINESIETNGGRLMVKGILQRCDALNQNGRTYPRDVLEREVEKYKQNFVKKNMAYGELDHPERPVVELKTASHIIKDIWWEGNNVMGLIEVINDVKMPCGAMVETIIKRGYRLGISSRGMGSVKPLGEGNAVEVQDDFEIVCWDFVSNPSTHGAFMEQVSEGVGTVTYNKENRLYKINTLISDIISLA